MAASFDARPGAARRGAVAALGNLDGVHLGHQKLVADARILAERLSAPLAAAVFEPHPRRFFRPDDPPFRLQTPAQRVRALTALGVAHVFTIPFDGALAASSDADFAQRILADQLGLAGVAVGEDFHFGRGRMGDVPALSALGARLGFQVIAVPEVRDAAGAISSTRVRDALAKGDVAEAHRLLGRPWAIEGRVQPGLRRARDIGFPTANVPLGEYVRPLFGVYAVRVSGPGLEAWPGVANIGVKPTLAGGGDPLLEAHLFDFDGDLYGAELEVELMAFLRAERRFPDFEALKAQIAVDAAEARACLG